MSGGVYICRLGVPLLNLQTLKGFASRRSISTSNLFVTHRHAKIFLLFVQAYVLLSC